MDVRDFFNLPEDQRDLLVNLHRKQKQIRHTHTSILEERQRLVTREFNNQQECEHPFAEATYTGHGAGGGIYHYHCQDCGKRWTATK